MIIVLNRKELSKEIKRANTRLVALEKKGLADTSRAYQYQKQWDLDYISIKNN